MSDVTPSTEVYTEDDATQVAFYTAACDEKDQKDMEKLLQKGLYGKRLPRTLRGQKAADAFQMAFDLIGGIPRLALWADKNPSAFFALYSKMIPSTIQAQVDNTIRIEAPWMSADRLKYMDDPKQVVTTIEPKK